jgi:cysteine desulfurase
VRRVYLDYSATTPVHPEVAEALWPFFGCRFGNPSSTYSLGVDARGAVDQARRRLATFLGAQPEEIVFTSGGTESNNLAILGTALRVARRSGRIITSQIEHPAVLEPVKFLEKLGFQTVFLPVDRLGRVPLSALEESLTSDTILVSIMVANNETGIIQDIPSFAALVRRHAALFHTDAVQAFGKSRLDVNALGVDLLSISGHKAYAPKGVGALYVRGGIELEVPLKGGGHEKGLRPGTENVPGIVALGKVSEVLARDLDQEGERMRHLRTILRSRLTVDIEGALINSDCDACLSNTLSVCIPGVKSKDMIGALDAVGVCVSSGSACRAAEPAPSHVLLAMGVEQRFLEGSIRISMGRDTTEDDLRYAADRIRDAVKRLRNANH